MRSLISAILETIVLIISFAITSFIVSRIEVENPYESYSQIYPDSTLTPGIVLGYFQEGTNPTPEEAAVILWEKFISEDVREALIREAMPLPIAKLYCMEISPDTAKIVRFYYMIVIIEIILCLIFGITLPAAILRNSDTSGNISQAILDAMPDMSDRTYDIDGIPDWRVEDVESMFLMLIFVFRFCALILATAICCTFMPLVIAVNLVLFLVPMIFRRIFGRIFSKPSESDDEDGQE